MNFQNMSQEERVALLAELRDSYAEYKGRNLVLDMSRGKPGANQLELSMDLLEASLVSDSVKTKSGFDVRNYGLLEGIPECRALFAELLEVAPENVLVFGNSSLNIMFDYVSHCMTHGAGDGPWSQLEKIKFACPVPGYDRHFAILEYFGIEMVNIPMSAEGPDMDALEALVQDESVKGMICVPKYSNPEGVTFSDAVVRRIAALKPAAKDFRIIWDNAYCVHDLREETDCLLNIFPECVQQGSADMIIEVASTSKITFPGAGIAALAASPANIAAMKKLLFYQTIGHDKINQLRHTRFFRDAAGVRAHMRLHRAILAPKFQAVLDTLEKELGGTGTAEWNQPNGGYFISLDVTDGCAKRVVQLCAEAGVVLTPAGATFPYGLDPRDRNIRIAPTFPPVAELQTAVDLLCLCVKLTALEMLADG